MNQEIENIRCNSGENGGLRRKLSGEERWAQKAQHCVALGLNTDRGGWKMRSRTERHRLAKNA